MATREVIENYFASIHAGGWESYIADDCVFINSNVDRAVRGKDAYLEAAGRFFKATSAVDLRQMIVENDRAAAIARYQVRSPKGKAGVCDVAELLTVKDGKLIASAIFFDTKSFVEFMAQE